MAPPTIAHYNGTLQWHPAMAPRPLPQSRSSPSPRTTNHSTLQWHPTMARSNGTTSTAPCNGTLVPRPIRQSGSSPSPPIGSKNPYSYRYLGKNLWHCERLRGIWTQSTPKKPSKCNKPNSSLQFMQSKTWDCFSQTIQTQAVLLPPGKFFLQAFKKKTSSAKERSQIGVESGDPWASAPVHDRSPLSGDWQSWDVRITSRGWSQPLWHQLIEISRQGVSTLPIQQKY